MPALRRSKLFWDRLEKQDVPNTETILNPPIESEFFSDNEILDNDRRKRYLFEFNWDPANKTGEEVIPERPLNGCHSIVTSGHKWPGVPWPSGVFMQRRQTQILADNIGYIAGNDSTFAGSRNGHTPLLLWSYWASRNQSDMTNEVVQQAYLSNWFYYQLKDLERTLLEKIHSKYASLREDVIGVLWPWKNDVGLAVIFRKPDRPLKISDTESIDIGDKFSLSTQDNTSINFLKGNYSYLTSHPY